MEAQGYDVDNILYQDMSRLASQQECVARTFRYHALLRNKHDWTRAPRAWIKCATKLGDFESIVVAPLSLIPLDITLTKWYMLTQYNIISKGNRTNTTREYCQ